jgi:hypothetical protein
VAKPLPITLEINEFGIPPDPGKAGKATLEGIDSDNDGVRDDVQRWIALTYPDSEKTRAALIQFVRPQQDFLLDAKDKDGAIKAAQDRQKSIECLYYIRPEDAGDIISGLRAVTLNTRERSLAYIAADALLSGEVFTLADDYRSSCGFDPDLLEK